MNCERYREKTTDWESIFGSDEEKQVKKSTGYYPERLKEDLKYEQPEPKRLAVGQGSPAPHTANRMFVEF